MDGPSYRRWGTDGRERGNGKQGGVLTRDFPSSRSTQKREGRGNLPKAGKGRGVFDCPSGSTVTVWLKTMGGIKTEYGGKSRRRGIDCGIKGGA